MSTQMRTKRLNLRISPDEEKRILQVAKMSKAGSIAEVVRRALAVYEHLLKKRKEDGTSVVVREADGTETELYLL